LQVLSDPAEPSIDVLADDIWMPAMSGVELIQAAHQINPDLPVAMITARRTRHQHRRSTQVLTPTGETHQNRQVRDVLGRGLLHSEKTRERQALQQEPVGALPGP